MSGQDPFGKLVLVPFVSPMFPHARAGARLCVCDQGTDEWHRARVGIPTASRISSLVTPTGKPTTGKARTAYAYELAFERIYGRDLEAFTNDAMADGHAQEENARLEYARLTGRGVEQVGFVYGDGTLSYGASPDGVVNDKSAMGLVEIKRRGRSAMSKVLASDGVVPPSDEMAQMQFGMLVTGAKWCDYVLYFPMSRPIMLVTRIDADATMQGVMSETVAEFVTEIESATKRVKELAGISKPINA